MTLSPEPQCLSSITICRYDCSSADLNPIGAISKNDLRRFLVWAAEHLGYSELTRVVAAPPTAELEPVRQGVAAQVKMPCITNYRTCRNFVHLPLALLTILAL